MNAEQNVEVKIIEAAKIVFIRKGFDDAKMNDIAIEAGIGRTALHYYFRTKEMLFDAIFGQLIAQIFPNIEVVANKECPILDKIDDIIDMYASTLVKNPLLPIFVAREMHRDVNHLIQAILKNNQQLYPILKIKSQLQQAIDDGTVRKIELSDVVVTLVSLMVFPIITKKMMSVVFMNGDDEAFEKFYMNRRHLVSQIIHQMLTPDSAGEKE